MFASANGGIYVTKLDGKTQVRVPVRTGATGNGLVQVTPLKAGALTTADKVLIGQNFTTNYHGPTSHGFVHGVPGGPPGAKQVVTRSSGG